MTTPKPAAEAAEGTRPAGQAEATARACSPDCCYRVGSPKPAAGVEPPVVAVAGRVRCTGLCGEFSAKEHKRYPEWQCTECGGLVVSCAKDNPMVLGHDENYQDAEIEAADALREKESPREASATVERRHREAAAKALLWALPCPPDSPAARWLATGLCGALSPFDARNSVAQALADAEAYGRASALEKP